MKLGSLKVLVLTTALFAVPALAQEIPDIGFKSVGRGRPLAFNVQGKPEVGPNWIRQPGQLPAEGKQPFPMNGYTVDNVPSIGAWWTQLPNPRNSPRLCRIVLHSWQRKAIAQVQAPKARA